METYLGGELRHFHFCLHAQWGQFLKEKICSTWSKFFSLRVDPFLEGFCDPGSQESCTPLKIEALQALHDALPLLLHQAK